MLRQPSFLLLFLPLAAHHVHFQAHQYQEPHCC
jgi:hypothetical protein